MLKRIIKALNLEALSHKLIVHLFLVSFLVGCFNALFFITTFSEFINSNKLSYYPQAITGGGILGIILLSIYRFFHRKKPSGGFISLIIIVMSLLLSEEILTRFIFPDLKGTLLLVIWLPATISVERVFTMSVMNMTTVTPHKNTIRFLESATFLGSVTFSGLIVALASMNLQIPFTIVANLLLTSIAIYFILIQKAAKGTSDQKTKEEPVDSLIVLLTDLQDKKTVIRIQAVSLFSIITLVFIEYMFLSAVSQTFISNPGYTIQFFGFIFFAALILTFLFKMFVYQNLIKTFRLTKALKLSPLVVLFMIFAISVISTQNKFLGPFSFTFLSIIFCRIFVSVVRESFEFYSLKFSLAALEIYSKKNIAFFLLNIISLWSFIFAGLLILLVHSIEYPFNYIWLISIFCIVWLVASVLLANYYSSNIQKIIASFSFEGNNSDEENTTGFNSRIIIAQNITGTQHLLNFQRNYVTPQYSSFLQTSKEITEENTKERSPKKTYSESHSSLLEVQNPYELYNEDIPALAVSIKTKDRIWAVKLIFNQGDPSHLGTLKMLLRDPDDEVKRNAIYCAATLHNSEIITELLEYLDQEIFSDLVNDVLVNIGNDAVMALKNAFEDQDATAKYQIKIIRTLSRINSAESNDFLVHQLTYPNKWIVSEAVKGLLSKNYIPSEFTRITQAIHHVIGSAVWLLAMDVSLQKKPLFTAVKKAVFEEYEITMVLLFDLLQLRYPSGVIREAKRNLLTNAPNEKKELSVEILASVIDEDMKSVLFPLLHNNRKKIKVSQLKDYFPVRIQSADQALKEILNYNPGYVSVWTKACALKSCIENKIGSLSDDVYAHVFNSDPLLHEIAFFEIHRSDAERAKELYSRLPDKEKKKMDAVFEPGNHFRYLLLYYKIQALQGITDFKQVKGHHLISLAEILSEHYLAAQGSLSIRSTEEEVLPFFMVPFGDVIMIDAHKKEHKLNNESIYGLELYSGALTFKALTDAVMYLVKPDQVSSLILNHPEILDALHTYLKKIKIS